CIWYANVDAAVESWYRANRSSKSSISGTAAMSQATRRVDPKEVELIRDLLRTSGIRATPARIAVMQELRAANSPLTHADVTEVLVPLGFDKATVFRNLNDLADAELISRTELGDHVWRFEALDPDRPAGEKHPHFVCVECGSVTCLEEMDFTSSSKRRATSIGRITEAGFESPFRIEATLDEFSQPRGGSAATSVTVAGHGVSDSGRTGNTLENTCDPRDCTKGPVEDEVAFRWLHEGVLATVFLVIGQAAALLSILLISRRISPSAFGTLSAGLALQNYLVLFGTLGLRTLVVRDLARSPQRLSQVWGTYWALVAPFGATVAVAGHVVAGLIFDRDPQEATMSLWLAGGAWFSMMSVVPLLDGLNRQRQALGIVALTEGLFLVGLMARFIPLHVAGLGAAFAIKWMLASVLQAIVLQRTRCVWRLERSRELIESWRFSIPPLLTTSLIVNLPLTAAVLLARHSLERSEAGVVGLGARFAAAVTLLGGVVVRFLQPTWTDAAALKRSENSGHFRLLSFVGVVGHATGCIVVALLVRGFLRPEYGDELLAILLLLTAGSLGIAARILWIALLALNDDRGVMLAYACGCFGFALAVGMAWWCGNMNGVSLATVVASGAPVLIAWWRVAAGLRAQPGERIEERQ
ncbi:Uncharacterized protein SCF082_LOCUS10073, partial [Durusdinium trenchii]